MVTEIANLLNTGLGLVKVVVDEKYAQKYQTEHVERMRRFQEVMDEKDDITRAARISGYVSGLCVAAGKIVMGVPTTSIEVPLEYFNALVECVSEGIRDRESLNKMSYAVAK